MTTTPGVSIEDLLDHGEWVLRLARALATDDSAAHDLAQDAWVAALERPPADGSALRSWFGTVLRNLAHNRARGDSRRAGREALARVVRPTDDPVELVARAEAQARAVRAVVALPEPYRETVLLHHFEGHPLREVALRTGVSYEAAKKRLQRAHAMLRATLDREHGGDRRAWLLPLLAGGRRTSRASAAAAAGVAAGVLALVTLGVVVHRGDGVPERSADVAVATAAPDAASPPPTRRVRVTADERPPSDAANAAAAAQRTPRATWPIDVRVVDESGAPIAGARVEALEYLDASPYLMSSDPAVARGERPAPNEIVTTDESGAARFTGLGGGDIGVVAFSPGRGMAQGYVRRNRAGRAASPVDLALGSGCALRGQVVDERGTARAGLRVQAMPEAAVGSPIYALACVSATTGPGGWFEFADLARGDTVVLIGDRATPGFRVATVALPDPVPLVVQLRRGGVVQGTVTDIVTGAPLGGVRVRLNCQGPLAGSAPCGTTDATGRYRIETLHPGRLYGATARLTGYVLASPIAFGQDRPFPYVAPDGIVTVDAALSRGGTVSGVVTIDGAPAPGVRVAATPDSGDALDGASVLTDGCGRYVLVSLAARSYTLSAHPRSGTGTLAMHPDKVMVVAGAAELHVDLAGTTHPADALAFRGRAVTADGRPLAGATATCGERRAVAAADGRFVVKGVARSTAPWVFVRFPGFVATYVKPEPGPDDAQVDVGDIVLRPPAKVRGTIRDEEGRPVVGAHVWIGDERSGAKIDWHAYSTVASGAAGFYVLDAPLAAGRFAVRARAPGLATASSDVFEHTGAPNVVTIDLVLRAAERVTGRVIDARTGAPLVGAGVAVVATVQLPGSAAGAVAQGYEPVRARTDGDGAFALDDLDPGAYVVGALAAGHMSADVDVTLPTTDGGGVTIALEPLLTIAGTLTAKDGRPLAGIVVHTGLRASVGENAGRDARTVTDGHGEFLLTGLLTGTYHVAAPERKTWVFDVPAGTRDVRLVEGVCPQDDEVDEDD